MASRNERWVAAVLGMMLGAQTFEAIAKDAPTASQELDGRNGSDAETPNTLILRGLDKISGHATDIVAQIGRPVTFATLTIIARYCYSTPPSEPPQTVAFLQINEYQPEQGLKRVFSGWMYASNPGLNGMDHPLYDVWVVSCKSSMPSDGLSTVVSTAPDKLH